jgi:hypothetical protein
MGRLPQLEQPALPTEAQRDGALGCGEIPLDRETRSNVLVPEVNDIFQQCGMADTAFLDNVHVLSFQTIMFLSKF